MTSSLLKLDHVSKKFGADRYAVHDISLEFPRKGARLVTLAGESGSGKSTLALMTLGFLPPSEGKILYKGREIIKLNGREFRMFRRHVQAIFQNPFEAFNPFYRVSHSLRMVLKQIAIKPSSPVGREKIDEAFDAVQLDPSQILHRFPHELSGGQLQRIAIARIIILSPELIVADEPVSMIDASLRLLVLRHLTQLKSRFGVNILYITHDLSTALQISDELLIAYRGEIVERGHPQQVINHPQADYTRLLVAAVPVPDPTIRWSRTI